MGYEDRVRACDVHDSKSFGRYVQQTVGVPYFTNADFMMLNKKIKEFKERYPHLADNPWPTLVRVAQWCRSKRKRPVNVSSVVGNMLAWAWQDGALPELDPTVWRNEVVETGIASALALESDPVWRDRLIGAEGAARGEVLNAWQMRRSSPSLAS